ncbi:MAG: hypothetical protein ACRDHK_09440 [Actinomycetota bacterium]
MSFESLLIDTLEVHNPVVPDPDDVGRYGDPVESETTFSVSGRVQPAGGTEYLPNRETRVTQFRVFLPVGTDVTGVSTLVWEGRTLRVTAEPETYQDASGPHHVELDAEEVLG